MDLRVEGGGGKVECPRRILQGLPSAYGSCGAKAMRQASGSFDEGLGLASRLDRRSHRDLDPLRPERGRDEGGAPNLTPRTRC